MILINKEPDSLWDDYICNHPEGTIYHLARWSEVLHRVFGFRKYYLSYRNSGRIAGVLPLVFMDSWIFGNKLHSLPILDYGGILADSPQAEKALAERAKKLALQLKVRYLELRHFEEMDLPGFVSATQKVTFFLNIDRPQEEIWKSFKGGSIRTHARRAEKKGCTVHFGKENLLREFYQIFSQNMVFHGTPVYPFRFFHTILQAFPQYVDIILIRQGENPVATAMVYSFQGKSEAPWAGSLRVDSVRPNDLMFWEILKHAQKRDSHIYDFGRSTRGSGTYQFKKKWTRDIRQLHWQYFLVKDRELPTSGKNNGFQNKIIQLWQRLPLQVANVLGPLVSRNIS